MDHTDPYWVLSEMERERALDLLGVTNHIESARTAEASTKRQRQIERGYFLAEVAESLAQQQDKPSEWAKRLLASMEEAKELPRADSLSLRLRDPHTGIIDPPRHQEKPVAGSDSPRCQCLAPGPRHAVPVA